MLKLKNHPGRPARIAIVRYNGYPIDVHVRRDAVALREAGFEVDLICMRDPEHPSLLEQVDGITVLRLPPVRKRGGVGRYMLEYMEFTVLATVATAVRGLSRRYSFVEINNLPDWLVLAAAVPKLLGAKITFYSREDTGRLFASDRGLALDHPAVRFLDAMNRACARTADRIIATQELARRDLVSHGIPAHKVVVIPNSPDEHAFLAAVPTGTVRPEAMLNRADTFRVVTHGTLLRRYGIETLLQAMDILRHGIPNIHLDIIGDGPYRNQLEELTDRLRLRSHVTFTGFLPGYDEVAPRLLGARIGINPIWTDFQLCNKLVEYLALGIPSITTVCEALGPYLNDSEVFYVEARSAQAIAEAVTTLYRDPDRRKALGIAGHAAYLRHFAWERAKHDYVALYRNRAGGEMSHSDKEKEGQILVRS